MTFKQAHRRKDVKDLSSAVMNKDQEYYEDRLICNRANILYYYKYGEALEKKRSKKVIRSSGVDWFPFPSSNFEHHGASAKSTQSLKRNSQRCCLAPNTASELFKQLIRPFLAWTFLSIGNGLEGRKENKPIKKKHHQKLIKCVERYAEARQKVLSIPGISVLEDIQYAMALIHEEYKANTWPDKFKNKYNLSLAESPLKEALVAARILEEYSDLTTVLHRDLNYDWHWAVNETGEMLDKTIGYDSSYDDHLEESEDDDK
ncbi:unnamed protein product [Rhizophagus irregularis]|nr:unnamed protein product [Rhizophagus irregularis]